MLCIWHKWRISKALDSRRSPARGVVRHMQTCGECREFARLGSELTRMSRLHLIGRPARDLGGLEQRILSRLKTEPPARLNPKTRGFPKPAAIAASAVAAASVMLAILLVPSGRKVDLDQWNPFAHWDSAGGTVDRFLASIESPYEDELDHLRQSLNASVEFFRSLLDVRLAEDR